MTETIKMINTFREHPERAIKVMRKHDLSNKKTKTNSFEVHLLPSIANHANTATTNLTGSWYLISSFAPGLHKDTSELQIRDTEPAAFTSLLEYIYLPQVQAINLRKS